MLSLFLAKAKKISANFFNFFIVAHKKLHFAAILEFNLKSQLN
jgi:hypothetical protein